MRIATVVGTWERLDLARQCVQAFRDSQPPEGTTLTFVVQGNDSATEGWLRNAGIDVIREEKPLPFAQLNNKAAEQVLIEGIDWLLLLNNDVFLQAGFWDALAVMDAHHFDICGAKLLYPNGTIQHFGKWFTLDHYPFHVLRGEKGDDERAMMPRAFPCVTFACAAISVPLWRELKGLDETFVNGYEDDDFCLRASELGGQIGVHPGMAGTHLESQTTGQDNANKAAQWQKFKERWVDTGRIQWPLGQAMTWRWL